MLVSVCVLSALCLGLAGLSFHLWRAAAWEYCLGYCDAMDDAQDMAGLVGVSVRTEPLPRLPIED